MKMEVLMMDAKNAGREEGIREGKIEGKIGSLVYFVCRKLSKGKAPEEIAEDWGADPEKIRLVCEAAAKYAPNYDNEKIVEELMKNEVLFSITSAGK